MILKLPKWLARPIKISVNKHGLSRALFDDDAVQAVLRLQKAGFEAYVVGGAVRDLLLGVTPKDFDISTNATPAEVRRLFRRARIIGRRFKIVHLYFYRGKKMHIIEVTTFRADGDEVISDENGRILQDNLFGSAADDAVRRDFTCNALFYEPATENIIDHTGGYGDIRRGRLRLIGAPTTRFRQDPVRLLRALRLGTKLNLALNQTTQKALFAHASLLVGIAPSRLFDEFAKIINSGVSADIIRCCAECGITSHILPAVTAGGDFFLDTLKNADRRRQNGKEISLSFIVAALFWPPVAACWRKLQLQGMPSVVAMERALEAAKFSVNSIVPKRIVARAVDLYFLRARFEGKLTARRARGVLRHPLFDRAVAFAALCGNDGGAEAAQWWSNYQLAGDDDRKVMIAALGKGR